MRLRGQDNKNEFEGDDMKHIGPLAAAWLGFAVAASAQETPRNDALNVTATRIERPSLETPASVDSVQADDIRFARPQVNLSESLGRVPGIMVQNRQNYAQDLQVSSRGFGTRATFGIRGIRLIADGIPASMPDGQGQAANFDLGSAERIEVLRGPFAVMYGNAAGGVINVITESGAREPGVSLAFAAGSYGMLRGAVRASDRSADSDLIVSMSHFGIGGYRDHSSAARDQANAKLNFGLSETTKLTLLINAYDSPDVQDPLGLTRAQMTADPRQADPGAITFNTRKSVRQNQAGATITHQIGQSSLDVAAYLGSRQVLQYLALAGTGATSSGGVVDLDRGYGGTSLRFTHPLSLADRPFTLIVGAEYEVQAEHRRGYVNNNGVEGALKRDEDDDVTSTGVYAQGEWRFAEKWIALAGVRANQVAFKSEDHYIVGGATPNPDDSGSVTYRATTPMAGLLYRVAPTTSLYANYGRGFETPTFAELAYRPTGTGLNFALLPSRSRHTEAGIKSVIGAARVNFAIFNIDTDDEIVIDTNVGGRQNYQNAGRTRRRGAELSAQSALPLGFDATISWTYLDARFRDSFVGNGVTVPADNVLPGVARNMFYGELRWGDRASGFTAALEAVARSRVAVNDVNSDFAEGYAIANLAAGFTQERGKWRFSEYLRVDNVGDKRYVGSVIVNDGNNRFFEPAPGRNAMIGAQARTAF
jgi:iron complex outermembrane receptor protein